MKSLLDRHCAAVFLGLWSFAIFVSVFDGYLALRYRNSLAMHELNPLGQLLITLNDGQVWYLLIAKFAGTVAAASLVLVIHASYPRFGLPIVGAVAGLQLGLLLFLLLA
ncbi:MAG: hypothetical protein L0211_11440 [Planctomycetaceae bacterium]|nr:hypothetical protein [Planctomycetaceae bacterium]